MDDEDETTTDDLQWLLDELECGEIMADLEALDRESGFLLPETDE